MKIYVTARSERITDSMKEYIQDKLNKVEKYSHKSIETHVILDVQKYRYIAEVTIKTNITTIHSKEEDTDMSAAIDRLVDKVERQMQKSKEKIQHHKIKNAREFNATQGSEGTFDQGLGALESAAVSALSAAIVREEVMPKDVNLKEALVQANLHRDHFIVFKCPDTQKIKIINKLNDDSYELFERKDHIAQGTGTLTVIKHLVTAGKGGSKDEVSVDFSGEEEFIVDFMTQDEASRQLKSSGRRFLLFFDRDSGKMGLIYQKKSGTFGLIESNF